MTRNFKFIKISGRYHNNLLSFQSLLQIHGMIKENLLTASLGLSAFNQSSLSKLCFLSKS